MAERKSQRITLVKVPKILAEYLEKQQNGTRLGALEEAEEGRLVMTVETASVGFPKRWIVEPLEAKSGMFTFSQRGLSAYVDGVVGEEMYIRPEITQEYLRYKREREAVQDCKREVKPVDSLREGIRIERHGATEYDMMARRRKKLLIERKRERLAKTEVMDIIFRAFEEYPFWNVKDLADRSGQPQAYIQEILSEIAVMNKKSQRNMYELKPEYRNG